MNKKHLIMILTAFLIIPVLVPQGCAQNETSESTFYSLEHIIKFNTVTEIKIDNETLPDSLIINPGGSINNIEAAVKFKFEIPFFFPKFLVSTKIGKWIMFRDAKYDMSVNISLSFEKPDWVDVDCPKQIIIKNIGTSFEENLFKFNISVKQTAEALQEGNIKIKATFTPDSAWGLTESEDSDSLKITSGYVGKLNASFDFDQIIFKAGETKTIPLKIVNEYNGVTIVEIQPSKKILENGVWNISLEEKSITLKPGENQTINVNISVKKLDSYKDTGDSYFDDIIVLTPKSNKNTSVIGTQFIVKSPELIVEEEGSIMDILLMVIYAVIIIVVIAVILILVLRRLRR